MTSWARSGFLFLFQCSSSWALRVRNLNLPLITHIGLLLKDVYFDQLGLVSAFWLRNA
jgi:hypothetical protein